MLNGLTPPRVEVLVLEDLTQQRLPARAMVAALRQSGLAARFVHYGRGSDPDTIVALACQLQPRLIVLSILFGHLLSENARLAERLRAAGVTAHLAMAGPLPAFTHAELLASCRALDSVLLADAETSVSHLAAAHMSGRDITLLTGLACRSTSVSAERRDVPSFDLDTLPFPARDDGVASYHGVGFATIEGSRGCYHACSFCLPCAYYRDVVGVPYRLRSVGNLIAEIEWLYARGVRLFLFDDEQFLPPLRGRAERVTHLGTELRQRALEIAFTIKCRPDDVEDALFQQLREMGLLRVYLGLESGCQTTLDVLDKRITVGQNFAALATLDRLGVVADFRCLMFHPWTTLDTIKQEIDFLEMILPLAPTVFAFHEVECFPGTPIHRRLMKDITNDIAPRPHVTVGSIPTPWSYVFAEPRVEMLRRASRRVFQPHLLDDGIAGRTTAAWYAVLLSRSSRDGPGVRRQRDTLRAITRAANTEMVAIWREMISLAEATDPCDTEQLGRNETRWADRLNRLDLRVSEELGRLSTL